MRAIQSNIKRSTYGGVVPVLKKVKQRGIPQLIISFLGKRVKQSKYSHADIFINWLVVSLCGGRRVLHIEKYRKKLPFIRKIKFASHDTIGRGMKRLATEITIITTISREKRRKKRTMEVNEHFQLNRLLVAITKRMGAIKEGPKYTMDYDATFIPTQCRGAVRKYKRNGKLDYNKIGFSPMVCLINDFPIFISNRNGDAGSRFQIFECLENCLNILDEQKISIGRVISDSAGYNKKAMAMLNNRGIKFNMRFPHKDNMDNFDQQLITCKTWRQTEIVTANNTWYCEIADIDYTMSKGFYDKGPKQNYRVVAIRIPYGKKKRELEKQGLLPNRKIRRKVLNELRKKKLLKEPAKAFQDKHWKKIGDYEYKFFVTNDFEKSSEEIVIEYNKRGTSEQKFHFMKEDYGWELPPFSKMNENTVFLIASSIANNIIKSSLIMFLKEVPMLNRQSGLQNFVAYFVIASCTYKGGGLYEFDVGDIDYVKLME